MSPRGPGQLCCVGSGGCSTGPEPVSGAHLGAASCYIEGWPSPSSWFGSNAPGISLTHLIETYGPGAAGHWSGPQLVQRASLQAPKSPEVLRVLVRAPTRVVLSRPVRVLTDAKSDVHNCVYIYIYTSRL